MADFTENQLLKQATECLSETKTFSLDEDLLCGVDLGTASIIMVVLDHNRNPVATEMQVCSVAKDGLVVDYIGAIEIVQCMKEKLEQRLGAELKWASIAVPSGTNTANCGTHKHIVEACGMEVTEVLDEPTAANAVLGISNGVVVDIGGGTTGLSVFQNGEVLYTADEATGGTHVSLVLMGRYKISFEEAETMKQDATKANLVRAAVLPVLEKMASIVKSQIEPFAVTEVWLVGGTACLQGIEDVFTRVLGVPTKCPEYPMMVTPLGIALNCKDGL